MRKPPVSWKETIQKVITSLSQKEIDTETNDFFDAAGQRLELRQTIIDFLQRVSDRLDTTIHRKHFINILNSYGMEIDWNSPDSIFRYWANPNSPVSDFLSKSDDQIKPTTKNRIPPTPLETYHQPEFL
jgi:hypothetical protein